MAHSLYEWIVDAQLPPRLKIWLNRKGEDAVHVFDLENGLRIPDTLIWQYARLLPMFHLVPPSLRRGTFREDFFARFAAHDKTMQRQLEKARLRGVMLRYVGTLEGTITTHVSERYPRIIPSHPRREAITSSRSPRTGIREHRLSFNVLVPV